MSNKDYYRYQHVEKLGSDEVDGILIGDVYVFPKIDGTNGRVWFDGTNIRCGSRNREISLEKDNAGFMDYVLKDETLCMMAKLWPNYSFFGEWLVPHSLKTYREDAWRKFYIFDIVSPYGKHLPYDECVQVCNTSGCAEYLIPPMRVLVNPSVDDLMRCLDENKFLIEDGKGVGEGVVLKNYSFVNKYGRTTWAKIVTNEFKEKHHREMGAPVTLCTKLVEQSAVAKYVTEALIDKTLAKITTEEGVPWESKMIPRLLNTVWHDLVTEHIWDIVKENKNPKIDFKVMMNFCFAEIKRTKPELF